MLQYLHQALDLFYQVPVVTGMQVPECGPNLHLLHVLGQVQEQGTAADIPDNGEEDTGVLHAWCCPSRLIPARLGIDTLVHAGNIDGWDWG